MVVKIIRIKNLVVKVSTPTKKSFTKNFYEYLFSNAPPTAFSAWSWWYAFTDTTRLPSTTPRRTTDGNERRPTIAATSTGSHDGPQRPTTAWHASSTTSDGNAATTTSTYDGQAAHAAANARTTIQTSSFPKILFKFILLVIVRLF